MQEAEQVRSTRVQGDRHPRHLEACLSEKSSFKRQKAGGALVAKGFVGLALELTGYLCGKQAAGNTAASVEFRLRLRRDS